MNVNVKYMPMLAKPLPDGFVPKPHEYVAEMKYDGHRMLTYVEDGKVTTWSRTGKDSARKLSAQLTKSLTLLPDGVYDGELVHNGGHSYDVSRITNVSRLTYVVFDVLETEGVRTYHKSYTERRAILEDIFDPQDTPIVLALKYDIDSRDALDLLAERIWTERGEGLIVKRLTSAYHPGKRSDAFYKLKQCQHAVLTVVGFEGGTTTGECTIVLRDDDGNVCSVKIKNDAERARIRTNPNVHIGRRFMITYHERTPDGAYRHPMADRFEDE